MTFAMRKSKFRHVFGKALKREDCYDNIRITKMSWDSTFCTVNPKYVAIITEAAGGGSFLVLPIKQTGRVERDHPLVSGHKGAVLDIAFCPHNDDVIASGSEDCTVKVWQIPEGGLVTNLTEPIVNLVAHQRRVGLIKWHPTAQNILLSAGSDNKVFIWNVGTEEIYVEIELPDLIYSASFNYNGSKFVCTCKDKKLRIIDARTGKSLKEKQCHEGAKNSQAVFLKDGSIFTTGFSRMSERQYALWDGNDLSEKCLEEIDQSNGIMFPFYDPDTNMIYLCGKGDSIIRYYEVTDEAPYVHYLSLYQSKDAMRGFGAMSKRGLTVNNCETFRFYKLLNNGVCEVIPFTVPRKSELFQDDLYPDTASDTPAISAEDWFSGNDADPVLMSMKDLFVSDGKETAKVVRKSNILDKKIPATPARKSAPAEVQHARVTADATPAASTPASSNAAHSVELPPGVNFEEMLADIKTLKQTVKTQDKKIQDMEARLSTLESRVLVEEVNGGEDQAEEEVTKD